MCCFETTNEENEKECKEFYMWCLNSEKCLENQFVVKLGSLWPNFYHLGRCLC